MKIKEQIEAMSDEERRIKTAGIIYKQVHLPNEHYVHAQVWSKEHDGLIRVPDYLNSLDAMHEAIMFLPESLEEYESECEPSRRGFFRELQIVTIENENWTDVCVNATARQRNTAFLMTMMKGDAP